MLGLTLLTFLLPTPFLRARVKRLQMLTWWYIFFSLYKYITRLFDFYATPQKKDRFVLACSKTNTRKKKSINLWLYMRSCFEAGLSRKISAASAKPFFFLVLFIYTASNLPQLHPLQSCHTLCNLSCNIKLSILLARELREIWWSGIFN